MPTDADGARPAADAILRAAAELFTSRDPAEVTLREVADHAGVNYGLVHRHFRTKEALLTALFRRLTMFGSRHLERSSDASDAVDHLFRASAGGFAQLFTSMVVSGVDPATLFGDTSAHEAFTALIERAWGERSGPFDARVVAGLVMLNIMIWDLYAP